MIVYKIHYLVILVVGSENDKLSKGTTYADRKFYLKPTDNC